MQTLTWHPHHHCRCLVFIIIITLCGDKDLWKCRRLILWHVCKSLADCPFLRSPISSSSLDHSSRVCLLSRQTENNRSKRRKKMVQNIQFCTSKNIRRKMDGIFSDYFSLPVCSCMLFLSEKFPNLLRSSDLISFQLSCRSNLIPFLTEEGENVCVQER